jgi:hypothetical protein
MGIFDDLSVHFRSIIPSLFPLSQRRQRPSGQGQEGEPRPCRPGPDRGEPGAADFQELGRDDPEGLRGGPDDLPPLRREDESGPGPPDLKFLTLVPGRNILFARGRIDSEFAVGDFMPSAKMKFLSI